MEALLEQAKLLLSFVEPFIVPLAVTVAAVAVGGYIKSSFFDGSPKVYGVRANVPGLGITYRNKRFLLPLETPFEGGDTIPALFNTAAKTHKQRSLLGTRPLLTREEEYNAKAGRNFEKVALGDYVWETYEEVHARAVALGGGLLGLGHKKGEMLAIFAETRADWFVGLQGAFQQGLVVVTVYASLGEEAVAHSLNETEVTTVICDSKQLDKILKGSSNLPKLKRVVVMDEQEPGGKMVSAVKEQAGLTVVSFSDVVKKGKEDPVQPSLPGPNDLAVIMYTSGSTGTPKGVMMTHANIVAVTAAVMAVVPNWSVEDVYFAYLPLAHVLELAAETGLSSVGISIGYGSPLTMINAASKVKKGTLGDTPALRPSLMAAVPAILDRIRDGVWKQINSKSPTVQRLFKLAYSRRLAAIEGSWFGAWGLERAFWDTLVFKTIRAAVGGNVRYMLSGGAPLAPDTQRFMNICFNIPIGQGYGLTETCAGGTFLDWHDTTVGRVGPPIPCAYMRLVDWEDGNYFVTDKPHPRGEIHIGGPSVTLGYWKNPEKTAQDYHVDARGIRWFHTGDIGLVHPDGVFEIIDRKKDIVKLQAGEYVSLGKVEAALMASPLVDNMMVYADPLKSFAVALVVPEFQNLQALAAKLGLGSLDNAALCANADIIAEVMKSLAKAGKEARLEKFEIPAKVKLLPDPWLPETGFVTASLKVKREAIKKAFADDLKLLYT